MHILSIVPITYASNGHPSGLGLAYEVEGEAWSIFYGEGVSPVPRKHQDRSAAIRAALEHAGYSGGPH